MSENSPHIDISETRGKENTSFPLSFQVKRSGTMRHSSLFISIQGVPNDWHCDMRPVQADPSIAQAIYDPITGHVTLEMAPNADFDNGPILTPPLHSDFDIDHGLISAIETDLDNHEKQEAQQAFSVYVDAVASAPVLDAMDAKGRVQTKIALPIYAAVVDFDGSEEITSVIFQNIPAGAKLTKAADLGAGRWSVLHKNLEDVYIEVPHAGVYDITVTATAQEINMHGREYDEEDNVAVTEKTFTLTVLD